MNAAQGETVDEWTRPESVPFPTIWRSFEGKKRPDGIIQKFWIQDITDEMHEEVIQLMRQNFIYEEPLAKYSGLAEDKESLEEFMALQRKKLKGRMGLICFAEDPNNAEAKPKIAGVNITYVAKNEEMSDSNPKGRASRKILGAVFYCYGLEDLTNAIGTEPHLTAVGLSVLPEFRGQNVGLELLKARADICRAVGLKATFTLFTAAASQKIAEKAGFKVLAKVKYDDLEKVNADLKFPGISDHTKYLKSMYKVYD